MNEWTRKKFAFHFSFNIDPKATPVYKILFLNVFVLFIFTARDLPAQTLDILWQIEEKLDSPESAYVDPKSGYLFLSQIVGSGGEKDGQGWISKLTTDGKWVKEKWVTGLNAPKGIRSHGDLLWVSDIDRIIGIRISTGKIIHRITV
ncbi:MAG: hypothetical protein VX438_02040, partial [Planctomycetota bacterium]|nr:hypothetical protein [Planctomycetota bacterium]